MKSQMSWEYWNEDECKLIQELIFIILDKEAPKEYKIQANVKLQEILKKMKDGKHE